MTLRTRAFVSIGSVLVALSLGIALVAAPVVGRTLRDDSGCAARLDAVEEKALRDANAAPASGARPPPAELPSENAALARLWIAALLAAALGPLLCDIALRALFKPIASLRRACRVVPELGAVVPLGETRSDELGQLCGAFDRMRDKVAQARDRARRRHEHLEAAVQQKTQQLAATVERLRSLDQMKDAFLSCASRELQAPVRSILAATTELEAPASAEPRPALLRRIQAHCRRLDRMTEDALDFVRTSAEGFSFRFERAKAVEVIRRALAAARARLPRSDVTIEDVQLGDCDVVWDATWIARILASIVVEAVGRAPSGGSVVVESRVQGPDVRIDVRFDSLPKDVAATAEPPSRVDRALWNPVLERHLGEWSERETDAQTSLVVVLPALAEHLEWSAVEPEPPK
jgi:signal transduction histidine kinase